MMGFARLLSVRAGKYGIALLAAAVLIQGYFLIRSREPALDPARAAAADRLTNAAAESLGGNAGGAWGAKYVRVARLVGDQGDHIRSRLETALPARTHCRLVTDSVLAEFRDDVATKAAHLGAVNAATADEWKGNAVTSLDDALALGRNSGIDYVVYGEVLDFTALENKARARVNLHVADVTAGAGIFTKTFEEGYGGVLDDLLAGPVAEGDSHAGLLFIGWLLFVMLLPLCSASFWTNLLDRESNAVNALCLIALTILGLLCSWTFMGFAAGTAWPRMGLALAVVVAGVYNLFILNILERHRTGRKFEA